jgi:HAE1 family hydrophobic/amphiphilic exporter-1
VSAFFVRRPIVAMVIALVVVIAGVVSMRSLPIAQFPEIAPPQVQVTALYTGADAVTVEQSVATPIEQQMNGVERMIFMQSINGSDGSFTLNVNFEVGTNPDTASVLAQNRVAQAQARLPPTVSAYGLTVKKAFASPLLVLSLYSPNGSYDNRFLANYATINLVDQLLRVHGVGDVKVFGSSDYSMRVWIDPDVLANLQLTVADLVRAVQRQSTVNPAGQLGAEPVPAGQEFTYTIRAKGRLTTADEFADVIVRENPNGSVVRMKDVARIDLGTETYSQIGRFNSKNSAVIAVYQVPGSNALETASLARKTMETARLRFPKDMAHSISLDSTEPVVEGIREIVIALVETLVLVIAVVFLFLQTWRATLIPLLTVPVSLLGTFILFPLFGFSINTLSLFGLVLAIGLVVDDAIVVVEAVQHHIEEGMAPRDATLQAMREVSGPVVAIALVLAAVFLPIAFVVGIKGRLFQQFALTIAASVSISAFTALSLSPALTAMLLRPQQKGRGLWARFFALFDRGFGWTTERYVSGAGVLVRKTFIAFVILLAFGAGAALLSKRLPTSFVPDEDQGFIFGNIQLPDAASLQRTDAMMHKLEDILAHTDGIESYTSVAGFSILTQTAASNQGLLFIKLKPWRVRKSAALSIESIVGGLNRRFAGIIEGRAFTFPPPAILGIGTSGGFDLMLEDRAGMSIEELAGNVEKFMAAAHKRPELLRLNSAFRPTVPQLFVRVNEALAIKQGVDLGDVYATLGSFMGGDYVNDFNRFGRVWRVYLEAEGNFRARPDNIDRFYVRNSSNAMVPLSTLVTIQPVNGPQFTTRFDMYRAAEVTGSAAPGYSSGQAMAALQQVAHDTLPKEMSFDWAGMSYQEQKAGGVGGTLVLALLLVFLILAAQYESWSLPFSVLMSTPIALFGALLGLFVRKLSFDVYGQIGLIMLVGLAAKNAILIVEFARAQLESEGDHTIEESALAAARLRFRPILMTSFAFIFGMLPLWVASGAGAVARRELGSAVIVGMLVATAFGVFVVPALFSFVERITRRQWRRRAPTPQPAPPVSTASSAASPGAGGSGREQPA